MERKNVKMINSPSVTIQKNEEMFTQELPEVSLEKYGGTVGVSYSKTINLGNYENIKLTITAFAPCEPDGSGVSLEVLKGVEKGYDQLSDLIRGKFEREINDIRKGKEVRQSRKQRNDKDDIPF